MAIDDAMELCQLLEFLDDWLATDHGEVNDYLTRFVGCGAYDVESLRRDGNFQASGLYPVIPHLAVAACCCTSDAASDS
jgi:hypothetical protein